MADIKLSNSSINSYLECPYGFYLRKIEKAKTFSNKNFILGKAYESAVVDYFKKGDFNFEKNLDIETNKDAPNLKKEELEKVEKERKVDIEKANNSINYYAENIGKNYNLISNNIYVEIPLDNVFYNVIGYADAILENKETGENLLIDFKTSGVKMTEINHSYKFQLALYSLALPQFQPAIHALVKTKKPQAFELLMTEQEKAMYQNIAHQTAIDVSRNIYQGNFDPLGLGKKASYGNGTMCESCLIKKCGYRNSFYKKGE